MLCAFALALVVPAAGVAGHTATKDSGKTPLVPASLLAQAQANPQQTFQVIVQGTGDAKSDELAKHVADWAAHSEKQLVDAANQADGVVQQDQANATALAARAAQAQQNAKGAKGNAAAKAAQAATAAQQSSDAAQAALAEAQTADSAAQAAFGAEADAIVDHHLKAAFRSITGDAMTLTGEQIVGLASHSGGLLSITPDLSVKSQDAAAGDPNPVPDASMWPASTDLTPLSGSGTQTPAIAIVDSGIDSSKADFGSRIVASVNVSTLAPNETADQEGHGTMVAGIAAGSSSAYPGAAPSAPLVDVHTADANGESLESDVITACDWILAHKDQYDIRVANFSMAGSNATSFQFDPLDRAVESVWLDGVVVVAAAGNQGTGTGSVDMSAAPGNDPFIITVGALDQNQTADPSDDTTPWWSAYGYTADGFSKPDIAAPGRYMVAPVPAGSTIANTVPGRIVAPGYIWMSGTSFAAPVVSGAAAQILAQHPDWTPDEVKGALMLTAAYLPGTDWQQAGVGEVDAASAASLPFDPPNPNENLTSFVSTDPTTGRPAFDAAAWSSAVQTDAAWSSAAWSSAAWNSAAWNSAAWASAAWSSSVFTASTDSAMQSLAAWSSASWAS